MVVNVICASFRGHFAGFCRRDAGSARNRNWRLDAVNAFEVSSGVPFVGARVVLCAPSNLIMYHRVVGGRELPVACHTSTQRTAHLDPHNGERLAPYAHLP